MRTLLTFSLVLAMTHMAVAQSRPELVDRAKIDEVELHRRLVSGKAATGTGLALIGAALVISLPMLAPRDSAWTFSARLSGPLIAGLAALPVAAGIPLWVTANQDRAGVTRAQLRRRLQLGRALVGVGVIAQLAALALGPVAFLAIDSPENTLIPIVSSAATLGFSGLVMMCAGVPLIATAKNGLSKGPSVSIGLGSIALTY